MKVLLKAGGICQRILFYEGLPVKKEYIHDVREYVVVFLQRLFGNVFLWHNSTI